MAIAPPAPGVRNVERRPGNFAKKGDGGRCKNERAISGRALSGAAFIRPTTTTPRLIMYNVYEFICMGGWLPVKKEACCLRPVMLRASASFAFAGGYAARPAHLFTYMCVGMRADSLLHRNRTASCNWERDLCERNSNL